MAARGWAGHCSNKAVYLKAARAKSIFGLAQENASEMDSSNPVGGMVWRTVLTILVLAGALVGALWYIGFEAKDFNLFQQFAVFLIAFIVAIAIVSIVWISWAGRRGWMRWH